MPKTELAEFILIALKRSTFSYKRLFFNHCAKAGFSYKRYLIFDGSFVIILDIALWLAVRARLRERLLMTLAHFRTYLSG